MKLQNTCCILYEAIWLHVLEGQLSHLRLYWSNCFSSPFLEDFLPCWTRRVTSHDLNLNALFNRKWGLWTKGFLVTFIMLKFLIVVCVLLYHGLFPSGLLSKSFLEVTVAVSGLIFLKFQDSALHRVLKFFLSLLSFHLISFVLPNYLGYLALAYGLGSLLFWLVVILNLSTCWSRCILVVSSNVWLPSCNFLLNLCCWFQQ